MDDKTHFEKAIQRDIDTLLHALLDPTFKFSNVSSFVEAFDPILNSSDKYAYYLKKVIQASVFYYYLLMILRVSKHSDILTTYPFNRLTLTENQKTVLIETYEHLRARMNESALKDILLKELTAFYKNIIYNADINDLLYNIDAVWSYLLEIGPQKNSLNITEIYNQRRQQKLNQDKKVTNFTITEDMLEAEP